MPSARIVVQTPIYRSPRVQQVEGLFDIARAAHSERTWNAVLPLNECDWNIGLIVGPSGCGKTTLTRALFRTESAALEQLPPWAEDASILDGFPEEMPIKTVVEFLSSVGFSSPPAWLRPYRVLSAGERFRADLARFLAFAPEVAVLDEYTSVVDRTVARIGSAALAKTIRRLSRRFIAVTCHEDVEEWLQPDWTYRPATETFAWRRLQRRPLISLEIFRCRLETWRLFRAHHYLNSDISPSAQAFLAVWQEKPVAFSAWVNALVKGGAKREHRTVVLPDYQGVGIGRAVSDFCASMWKGLGFRTMSTTAHPAFVAGRLRSGLWELRRTPALAKKETGRLVKVRHAKTRLTAGFEYVGPSMSSALAKRIVG